MNTSSPCRKFLTWPKKCNSRNNTPLHMEKRTSPNIFVSSIVLPQPAATRKRDIRSFSDMSILCQDNLGRVKVQLNSAKAQRPVIMALCAWLESLFSMVQFDLYLPGYRHKENRGMTFMSTLPPQAVWGVSVQVCLITGNPDTFQATVMEVSVQRLQPIYYLSVHEWTDMSLEDLSHINTYKPTTHAQ